MIFTWMSKRATGRVLIRDGAHAADIGQVRSCQRASFGKPLAYKPADNAFSFSQSRDEIGVDVGVDPIVATRGGPWTRN